MSFELYQQILKVPLVLMWVIVAMAFFRYPIREVKTKLVGLSSILGIMAYYSLGIFDLRGMEVNIAPNTFSIANFLILTVVYYYALNRRYRLFYIAIAIGFLAFALYNILFWQKMEFNAYTLTVSSFIVVVYCVLYWYRLLVELPVQQLQRLPMFWFNSAFLIFNAGTLFLFLFTSYLVKVLHDNLLIYWTFVNILDIFQQSVILIGLWQDLRNIKSGSSLSSAP